MPRTKLAPTAQRGYGGRHQQMRRALLPQAYGTPCVRCGRPMLVGQALDLDHTDDREGYRGFAHAGCNRGAANTRRFHPERSNPALRSNTDWTSPPTAKERAAGRHIGETCPIPWRTCAECGVEFWSRRAKDHCSKPCNQKAAYRDRPWYVPVEHPTVESTCVVCGRVFTYRYSHRPRLLCGRASCKKRRWEQNARRRGQG